MAFFVCIKVTLRGYTLTFQGWVRDPPVNENTFSRISGKLKLFSSPSYKSYQGIPSLSP